jgi:hypothetical protein
MNHSRVLDDDTESGGFFQLRADPFLDAAPKDDADLQLVVLVRQVTRPGYVGRCPQIQKTALIRMT